MSDLGNRKQVHRRGSMREPIRNTSTIDTHPMKRAVVVAEEGSASLFVRQSLRSNLLQNYLSLASRRSNLQAKLGSV